ncbi:lamin tail domain-containing protein [Streptomyces clavifer]|uniref:lamin tail domain-containing protein n=1 Tax=Streptomyces clavifer TaxID=68188 RepID=UPI0037FAF47C
MSRSARRITATVLASGALLAAAALPATADGRDHGQNRPAQRSAVVLGEIQYESPGRDNGSNRSLNAEWVTVTNTGRRAVNLRGWTLTDESRRTYEFDLRLPGRSSVRVHTGVGRDSRHDVYQNRRHYVWDSKDTATLRDRRGHRVDSESWGRHRDGGHNNGGHHNGGHNNGGHHRGGGDNR